MKEKALILGEDRSMVGISTDPERGLDADLPTLIVLNSGLIHRVGPYRLSVKVARRVAQEGFLSVRFDLTGVGDSGARRDTSSIGERAVADTRAVMDHIERTRGVKRFVLMGLCSGADNSFQTARCDDRVVGTILLDGYAYRTRGYYARYYGRRLADPQVWARFAKRAVARARQALARRSARVEAATGFEGDAPGMGNVQPQYVREFPPRREVAADLRRMIARGTKLYFGHTAGMELFYNYEDQLKDAFADVDFGDSLTLDYFADADHTFTELESQRRLIDAVAGWMNRSFRPHAIEASASVVATAAACAPSTATSRTVAAG